MAEDIVVNAEPLRADRPAWAIVPHGGEATLRPGPGTAVVGSATQVVGRLKEYEDLGVDTFILSGNPLLEEAYRVAETVLPALGVRT